MVPLVKLSNVSILKMVNKELLQPKLVKIRSSISTTQMLKSNSLTNYSKAMSLTWKGKIA